MALDECYCNSVLRESNKKKKVEQKNNFLKWRSKLLIATFRQVKKEMETKVQQQVAQVADYFAFLLFVIAIHTIWWVK